MLARRVRARLRLVPPGREPAAASTSSCMAAPRPLAATGPLRFADLYVDPAHGNYDPEHRIITRAAQRQRRRPAPACSTAPSYPWPPQEAAQYGFPLDWLAARRRSAAPARAEDPRLGAEMQRRMGRGDTAVNLGAAGLVAQRLSCSPASARYRGLDREYVGAWRERAARQRRRRPGQRRPGRRGRQPAGRPLVRRPLRLVLAARLVQRRRTPRCVAALAAALATGDDGYLDLVRRPLDDVIGRGRRCALHRGRLQHPSKWDAAARRRTSTRPPCWCPFRHSDRGWFDYNPVQTARAGRAVAPHRRPADRRPAGRGCARPSGYDWRTVRPFRSKEEAGHEEPWFAFLRGDNPGYPEQILAAAQAQVRHRLALHGALPRPGRRRGRHPPVAAVQPGGHRGPGPADLGRPAGALQRRAAAGPGPLLRRRPRAARACPPDVAALVSSIDPQATVVDLVNLDPRAGPRR